MELKISPQRANYLGHLGRGTDSRDDTEGFTLP